MTKEKLYKAATLCLIFTAAFTLSMVSFHADISLIAFPLALAFTFFLFSSFRSFFKNNNTASISLVRELLQYAPYVLLISFVFRRSGETSTAWITDFVSVILWCISSLLVLYLLHWIHPKRAGALDASWGKALLPKKRTGPAWIVFEVLSWIDALVQAVFMVLLLNIFIVQLYEIPSESMVPEFLIKDRVVVFKTTSGPKFPLSNIGIPYVKKYHRGDIVVFRNPHYSDDRKSEVKSFLSQIVYMISLTSVNLNVDEDGNPKADPLVKRVCGLPGEQLMMQDGILYSRTADSDEFKPVTDDEKWAAWNLNTVDDTLKERIQQIPLSSDEYQTMVEFEEERNNLDVKSLALECRSLANRFSQLYGGFVNMDRSSEKFQADEKALFEYYLFSDNVNFTVKLLRSPNGASWFSHFMTDWISKSGYDAGDDLYSKANYRLNLMIKRTVGNLIVRNTELLATNVEPSSWQNDGKRKLLMQEAEKENIYCLLLDRRNMSVFPANDPQGHPQYIPENCYFMMGDNRFNSLDMRHSYNEWIKPLTPYDDYSITYYTNLDPQYVNRQKMLGSTCFRFWPKDRIGIPGNTGMGIGQRGKYKNKW